MSELELLSLSTQLNRKVSITDFLHAQRQILMGKSFSQALIDSADHEGLSHFSKDHISLIKERQSEVHSLGIKILYPGHPQYPESFFGLMDPPLCLLVLGEPASLGSPGVSVVGSRNPHELSLQWMEDYFSAFLQDQKSCTVFSGGARGVDQMAHRLAIRKGRPTVVYLPSGLGAFYPKELNRWQQEVLSGRGAFVSEYWLDQNMRPHHFRQRNRMIAQSGHFLLVVEARMRSGSIMTANLAAAQGREVAVIPSHPGLIGMRGSIKLIQEGATPLIDDKDLKQLWPVMSETQFIDSNI